MVKKSRKKMNIKTRIIRNSILAILLIVAFNFAIIYSLGSPQMAFAQIKKYLALLILLVGGFAFQIGLFTYLRHKEAVCYATTAVSGSISGISMILCCSHYLVNILPFISLSAASFFTRYTLHILLFGIASNIFGIFFMLNRIRKINKDKKIKVKGGKNG